MPRRGVTYKRSWSPSRWTQRTLSSGVPEDEGDLAGRGLAVVGGRGVPLPTTELADQGHHTGAATMPSTLQPSSESKYMAAADSFLVSRLTQY